MKQCARYWVTVMEAVEMLGVSRQTMYNRINKDPNRYRVQVGPYPNEQIWKHPNTQESETNLVTRIPAFALVQELDAKEVDYVGRVLSDGCILRTERFDLTKGPPPSLIIDLEEATMDMLTAVTGAPEENWSEPVIDEGHEYSPEVMQDVLARYARLIKEIRMVSEPFDIEIDRLIETRDAQTGHRLERLAGLEAIIDRLALEMRLFSNGEQKSVTLPAGTVKTTGGQPSIVIGEGEPLEAVMEWAEQVGVTRTVTTVEKSQVTEQVAAGVLAWDDDGCLVDVSTDESTDQIRRVVGDTSVTVVLPQ